MIRNTQALFFIMLMIFPFFLEAKDFDIKISGNLKFKEKELIQLIDKDKKNDLDELIKKIIQHYQDNGYFYAKINIKSISKKLIEIHIEENEAVLIDTVSIAKIKSMKESKLKSLYEEEALKSLKLKKGDILLNSKITEAMISFKKWLLDNGFLFSKDVKISTKISAKTKKAGLFVQLEYGPRVSVGFRNNKEFNKSELKNAVLEITEVSSKDSYVKSIIKKLKEKYNDIGLINAKIQPLIRTDLDSGRMNISFIIDEGTRVRIDRVDFSGIYSLSREELLDIFFNLPFEFIKNRIFQKEEIERAGLAIEKKLKINGYLSANFNFIQTSFDKDRKNINIKFLFTEGLRTFVSSIVIEGLRVFTLEELKNFLELKEQSPFNIFKFEEKLALLEEKYRNKAYLDFKVINMNSPDIVRYSSDQTKASISIKLNEGKQIRVGAIEIKGNKKTKDKVIKREIPFKSGDILKQNLIVELETKLQELDLFQVVSVQSLKDKNNKLIRNILITVEDGHAGVLEFGPGFRNDLGLRFFAAISYRNLGGWNRSVIAEGFINRRLNLEEFRFLEYNIDFGFKEPYLFGAKLNLLTNLIFLKRQLTSFDVDLKKINLEVRKKLSKKTAVFLQYSYENINTFNAREARNNVRTNIASISPGFSYNSTNSSFNPSKGIRSRTRIEIASPSIGSENNVSYHRLISNNALFAPVFLEAVWKFAIDFGFERSNLEGEEIPNIKLFRLGGVRSIRGYREDSLEVDSRFSIEGTLSFLNYRTELQFPLDRELGLAFFWDAGNLYVDSIHFFDLRQSLGAGLRYRTPVGPISLDYARKLGEIGDRGDGIDVVGKERYRIHLSIGSF